MWRSLWSPLLNDSRKPLSAATCGSAGWLAPLPLPVMPLTVLADSDQVPASACAFSAFCTCAGMRTCASSEALASSAPRHRAPRDRVRTGTSRSFITFLLAVTEGQGRRR